MATIVRVRALFLLPVVLVLAASCGDAPPPAPGAVGAIPDTCAVATVDPQQPRVPSPLIGPFFGQEIWLSYKSEAHKDQGFRYPRTRVEALALARDLCRKVHAGEDIGALARRWSNGPWGRADGLVAVPEPSHQRQPDARDVALFRTPVGQLTPLLEFQGGFWFARRIDPAQGQALTKKLERAMRVRGRARVIHIHHAGAFPRRIEFDKHPQAKAVATAQWIITEARERGVAFDELARKWSNDVSRERGGLLETRDPRTGEKTEWVRWGDRNFPQAVLDVILEQGTPGEVWPEPVVSGMGVDVVLVLERRTD